MAATDRSRKPVRAWGLALVIILLQVLLSAGLFWANRVAEQAPGRLVASLGMADAGGVAPKRLPDSAFVPVTLPFGRCCATSPLVFRTRLSAAEAVLSRRRCCCPAPTTTSGSTPTAT